MNNNETLRSAMEVMDNFYKDTAVMLETLKGILSNDYGYKDISGNRVCWGGSSSILYPVYWSPVYLSIWFQNGDNNDEYISITIILKDYFGNQTPQKEYNLYGCKFSGVIDHMNKYNWLGIYSVACPHKNYKRAEKDGYTQVENPDHYSNCKIIKTSLWDMKDRQAVAGFAKQVDSL